jgi:undecaprenyl-diphosphatase
VQRSDTDRVTPEQRAITGVLIGGIALAIVIALAFGWLSYHVSRGATVEFDKAGRSAVHGFASPAVTRLMIALSFIGEPYLLWPFSVLGTVLFWRAGRKTAALMIMLAMTGGLILDLTLKAAFHRTRPAPYFDYPLPHSFSFPSGHSLFAVCFFGVLAIVISPLLKSVAMKTGLWLLTVAMISGIGFSRVYLGVHYPTDIIGGYAAALPWVLAIGVGNRIYRHGIQHT